MNLVTETPKIIKKNLEVGATIHLGFLDGLRALAALYVVFHHVQGQMNEQASKQGLAKVFAMLFSEGRTAVDLFIVISGFCLMLPVVRNNGVLRNGAVEFFKKRAKRILPTYYLAMALSLVLIFTVIGKKTGYLWDASIPVTRWDIITHLLMIQDFFQDTLYKINHTFWSISVEWHIYFLFPLMVLSWKKCGPMVTTLLSVIVSLALWFILGRTPLNVYGMSPHYIALFTFGMFAAQLSFAKFERPWKILLIICCSVGAIILHPILTHDFIVGICSAFLLTMLAKNQLIMLRTWLSWKPLVFVGTFAYSIYLIHAPLLQVISQYVLDPVKLSPSYTILFFLLIGIPSIVGCAYLFYLVGERPFMNTAKKLKLSTAN